MVSKSGVARMWIRRVARWSTAVTSHPVGKGLGVLVFAFLAFQLLPQRPGGERQSLTQIVQDGMSPVLSRLPSWLGLWDLREPKGVFHKDFPSAEEIVKEVELVMPLIRDLREKKFFRIFKVDLNKECPFWAREDLCSSPTGACSVCECTEDQIPLPWKAKPTEHFVDRRFYGREEMTPWLPVGSLHLSAAEKDFLVEVDGSHKGGQPTYVDLTLNEPGFTSYNGRNIWGLIYKENCISSDASQEAPCTEEELFVQIISGLQTAITVLASEYNRPVNSVLPLPLTAPNVNYRKDGGSIKLAPRHYYNLDLFRWRVAPYRKWMENLFLDFSLLLRTFAKAGGILEACPCNTGSTEEDQLARRELLHLLQTVESLPSARHDRLETPLFKRKQHIAVEQFTNISRIFNCVECEKCRLHGKVKLTALHVAIKATGQDGNIKGVQHLERNELTALINAIGYFGDSILIIQRMHKRLVSLRLLSATVACTLIAILVQYYTRAQRHLKDDEEEIETTEEVDGGGAAARRLTNRKKRTVVQTRRRNA